MTISVTFNPPLPSDSPAVFNTKAFTLVGDLNTWSAQANQTANDINQDAVSIVGAASAAQTSATTATTQAATATAQAGVATNQAASAAASAAAAEAALDSFDDRYLGAKASDPTVDNDGAALQTGALYWSTVANEMRVWAGSIWASTMGAIAGTLTFLGVGGRIRGDMSNATLASRVSFQSSTTNGATTVQALPNGTAQEAGFTAFNNEITTVANVARLRATSSEVQLRSESLVGGTANPMTLTVGSTELLRLDTTNGVRMRQPVPFGYQAGFGAGGTVSQSGSISSAVTINKPTGRINHVSFTLAPGAGASFTVVNSFVGVDDLVVVRSRAAAAFPLSVAVDPDFPGQFAIGLTNTSATTINVSSDRIHFWVLKGCTT